MITIDTDGRYLFTSDQIMSIFNINPMKIEYRYGGYYLLAFERSNAKQIDTLQSIPGMKLSLVSDYPKDPHVEILVNLDAVEFIHCHECEHIMPARGGANQRCEGCAEADDLSCILLHQWPYPDHY